MVWGRTFVSFQEGLRGIIWESIRYEASDGDWWCFMDGDEFYYDDPRQFLLNVPDKFGVVALDTIEFVPLRLIFSVINAYSTELLKNAGRLVFWFMLDMTPRIRSMYL